MKRSATLSEHSMQLMESRIPELAGNAVKLAYYQALTTSGKVIEAVNGKLVETTIEGEQRVIRHLAPPLTVAPGTKRIRSRSR